MGWRRPIAPGLLLALSSACTPALAPVGDAIVACATDADCPEQLVCRKQRCASPANAAPTVAVGGIERRIDSVSIPITASDPEADECLLKMEVDLGSGFSPISVAPASVPTSADGVTTSVVWAAPADLPAPPAGFRSGLRVRVTPSDAHSEGTAVTSEPFQFGNDSPVVEALSLDTASVSGLTVVRFTVSDSSSDPVQVKGFQLSPSGSFDDAMDVPLTDGPGGSFPSGSLTHLATATREAGGVAHSLTWSSAAAGALDRPAARIRILIADDPFAAEAQADSAPFVLDNSNSPPEILQLYSYPTGTVTTQASVDYELWDADGDQCVLVVEYSTDWPLWNVWEIAASASQRVGLASGRHTFVWQATQLLPEGAFYDHVRLRFTPSDSRSSGAPFPTPEFPVDRTTGGNQPPSVSLGSVLPPTFQRYVSTVDVPFTVSDRNQDLVDVRIQYSIDDGATWPDASGSPMAGLATTVVGTPYTFTWTATADLPSSSLDTDRDGLGDTLVVNGRDRVLVRMTPTDHATPPATGATSAAVEFALGNDVPQPRLSPLPAEVGGRVPLQLELADTQGDPSDVELEFRADSGDVWRSARLILGSAASLAASPSGTTHVVVWDSAAAPDDANPSTPQGLGPANHTAAELRIRASDGPGPARDYGLWWPRPPDPPFTVSVRNQTPPRVEPAFIKSDGALHNGLVPISYLLIDDEGDGADVLFEFSVDEGASWAPCTEATVPTSEGVEMLAASPGGVEHTFVWDSSANIATFAPSVRLQARAAGTASGAGAYIQLMQQRPVGLASGIGSDALFAAPVSQVTGQSVAFTAVADFNGDTVPDLAYVTLYGELVVRLGTSVAGRWTGFSSPGVSYPLFADGGAIAAGDVTCDGIVDLVVATNGRQLSLGGSPDVVQIFRGVGDGTFVQYAGSPITTSRASTDVHVADLDGDGHLDIVVAARFGAATVLFSNGVAPSCAFTESVNVNGGGGSSIGIGDLDHDGYQDLVFGDGSVFYGTSPATGSRFVAGSSLPFAAYVPHVADIDGDGFDDVMMASSGQGFAARSDGQRGFGAPRTFAAGASPVYLQSVDLNGDGLEDLLILNYDGHDLSVLLATDNGGAWDGGFVQAFSFGMSADPQHLALADLDRDGQPDLVEADRNTGVLTVLGDRRSAFGASSLRQAQVFPTSQFPAASRFIVPADLNLDGVPDLMVTGFWARMVLGGREGRAANGLFAPAEPWALSFQDDTPSPAVGDFDGDGFFDLVVARPMFRFTPLTPSAPAALFRGQPRSGGPLFVPGTAPSYSEGQLFARCTYATYIDSDPWLDVVVISGSDVNTNSGAHGLARSFFGSSNGTFTAGPTTDLGTGLFADVTCALADFNADGRVDFGLTTGSLWTLGVSGALTSFGPSLGYGVEAFGDYDLDGITDAFVARWLPDRIEVLHGSGTSGVNDGTFTSTGSVGGFSAQVTSIRATDFDGDGVLDLLATTATPGIPVTGFEVAIGNGAGGVGDGTFGAPIEVASPNPIAAFITTFDANGDLVPDIAAVDDTTTLQKPLTVISAMRTSLAPWKARIGVGPGRRVLGSDTQPSDANLLGVPLGGSYTVVPFHADQLGFYDHNRGALMTSPVFQQQLRGSHLAGLPAQLTPITRAWSWSGAHSLVWTNAPDAMRLEVRERFGPRLVTGQPQRAGLSLSGSSPRAVIVDLPLLPGRTPVTGKVRVWLRTLDFTRAFAWAADPLRGTQPGRSVLPLEGGEPVLHPEFVWMPATEVSDLGAPGTGPRFVIDAARSLIRVAVDKDAALQAFSVP